MFRFSTSPSSFVYMLVDSNGEITGYYDPSLHDYVPAGCIKISAEQWQENIAIGASHYKDGLAYKAERKCDLVLIPALSRRWRDAELADTDRFLLPDYPIDPDLKPAILSYRQALRDYPATGIKPEKPQFLHK